MKNKMLLLILTALLAITGLVSCKDSIITADRLPATARSFINEYFPETPVSYVKKDSELTKTTYEVVLQDGTEIEFDKSGEWDSVDCKRKAIPAAFVPLPSPNMSSQTFPGR